jgi:magnesium chelatase subunit I
VKKFYPKANECEASLMMEFVLNGLAAYSLISKKAIEGRIEFKDLVGSMMNFGQMNFSEEEDDLNEDDYR